MATVTGLLTVADYEKIPNPPDGRYELRRGELVKVTFPKLNHSFLQHRFVKLLEPHCGDRGVVSLEVPFRAVVEHDLRAVDVGVVATRRWDPTQPGYLIFAPEWVIEILSPSNTANEMNEKERLCLSSGCKEFWVVDLDLRLIKISTPDGATQTYSGQDAIPLTLFGVGSLKFDDLFAGL